MGRKIQKKMHTISNGIPHFHPMTPLSMLAKRRGPNAVILYESIPTDGHASSRSLYLVSQPR